MALSEAQKAIVLCPLDKHAIVRAVAGSGKSHTMVERIAYLVEAKRIDPRHIIAVMFNNSATLEFTERLHRRLGRRNSPLAATYHRLGTLTLKLLTKAGLAPDWEFEASVNRARYFTVSVIRPYCDRYGHKYHNLVADAFLGFVDRVKSDLIDPQQVWDQGNWSSGYGWFLEAYPVYEKARANAGKRFFSDLIYDPLVILSQSAKARALVADRYAHIIVDEYQDICESQQSLLRYVAGTKSKVMVVGDEDQTIYTWRGAKPSYILRDFVKDFPGAVEFKLTRTWRYGHALSCAANYVITNNKERADKLCISGNEAPKTTLTLHFEPVSPEAKAKDDAGAKLKGKNFDTTDVIVDRLLAKGCRRQDIAILVRTYSRSADAQFALLERSIPFRLEGGDKASVLDNPFVVAILGWLSLAAGRIARRAYVGEPDSGSIFELRPMLEVPRTGLSFEGSKVLCSYVLREPDDGYGFSRFIKEQLKSSDGQIASQLNSTLSLWKKVRNLARRQLQISPHKLISEVMAALNMERVVSESARNQDEARDSLELLNAFVNYANKHGRDDLNVFLSHIDNLRSFSDRAKEETDAIHMTSLHRSKGLEWDYVIMPGLAHGRFPLKTRHVTEDQWPAHLEDERRLFYVGMTRARLGLHLVAPYDEGLEKWLRGGNSGYPNLEFDDSVASCFLYESNLYLSSQMPNMLAGKKLPNPVSPEVFNRYLAELGVAARLGTHE